MTTARRTVVFFGMLALVLEIGLMPAAQGAPRWESISTNEQGYYHIDPASITRDGDRRSFNSLLDYRRPQTSASGGGRR